MKIEILGTGCSKCNKTKEVIEKVLKSTGVKAEVVKVEDIETILKPEFDRSINIIMNK